MNMQILGKYKGWGMLALAAVAVAISAILALPGKQADAVAPCVLTWPQVQQAFRDGAATLEYSADEANLTATVTVHNYTGCTWPGAFTSFKAYDTNISNQVFYDGREGMVGPYLQWTIKLPPCTSQVDTWYGRMPVRLTPEKAYDSYGGYSIFSGFARIQLPGQYCSNATPTATPTPTVVATPTPTPTVTTTPTSTPTPVITPIVIQKIVQNNNNVVEQKTSVEQKVEQKTVVEEKKVTEEKSKGLHISKTDRRDVAKPGEVLTYTIEVENTGDLDISDGVVKDTVPSRMQILAVSPDASSQNDQTVTWEGLQISAGEKKSFLIKARVKTDTPNDTVLKNEVTAYSNDRDLKATAYDLTVVKRPQVASIISVPVVQVPVTARTGAGVAGIVSALLGSGGLWTVLRKKSW